MKMKYETITADSQEFCIHVVVVVDVVFTAAVSWFLSLLVLHFGFFFFFTFFALRCVSLVWVLI